MCLCVHPSTYAAQHDTPFLRILEVALSITAASAVVHVCSLPWMLECVCGHMQSSCCSRMFQIGHMLDVAAWLSLVTSCMLELILSIAAVSAAGSATSMFCIWSLMVNGVKNSAVQSAVTPPPPSRSIMPPKRTDPPPPPLPPGRVGPNVPPPPPGKKQRYSPNLKQARQNRGIRKKSRTRLCTKIGGPKEKKDEQQISGLLNIG